MHIRPEIYEIQHDQEIRMCSTESDPETKIRIIYKVPNLYSVVFDI